jgi:hypothetical protein
MTSYTISLSFFLGFQIQFELLLLPEVNRTTLRLFGTLMMTEIIQTMSTVHPVRWLTTRHTRDLVSPWLVLWPTFQTCMTSTSSL